MTDRRQQKKKKTHHDEFDEMIDDDLLKKHTPQPQSQHNNMHTHNSSCTTPPFDAARDNCFLLLFGRLCDYNTTRPNFFSRNNTHLTPPGAS